MNQLEVNLVCKSYSYYFRAKFTFMIINTKKWFLPLFLVALFAKPVSAKEGMWLPYLLNSLNASEMQQMGLEIPVSAIYAVNEASLKDAIVSFGGFCTGEVISNRGLVLTNHHCGYGQIQQHSSLENDYLKNGFWAMSPQEELVNPGLHVTFIKYMKDVTNDLMENTHPNMDEKTMDSIVKFNRESLLAHAKKSQPEYSFFVRDFFYGNQFILFATQRYTDIRLVGAPPSAVGKFGADTDNWMWPRHTGDFSLFRIYSDTLNRPAEISEKNVPFTPETFLKINMDGAKDMDFTMIFGFPGTTEEYLPAKAVEQTLKVRNPNKIAIRDMRLSLLDARMRTSDAVRIKYASKYASISNGWKKWKGQNIGLREVHAIDSIRKDEMALMDKIKADYELSVKYGNILKEFDELYEALEPYATEYDYFVEIGYSGSEVMKYANSFQSLINAYENKNLKDEDKKMYKQNIRNAAMKLIEGVDAFFKDYDKEVDQEGMIALLAMYADKFESNRLPEMLAELKAKQEKQDKKDDGINVYKEFVTNAFAESFFTSSTAADLKRRLVEDPEKFAKKLKKDPIMQLTSDIYGFFAAEVRPELASLYRQIDAKMKDWMKVQMELSDKVLYPDANSTLRLTYGRVEGYSPNDSTTYTTRTYLDGVVAKYVPGDYEFDLPAKLIQLHKDKDYGPYADSTGSVPVCFIASNHTSGGNSGSPALNGKGELIGLNFDRVWEGTMSDLYFDNSRCRNIMVDARYVLFIVDKYAGAGYLLDEMDLVSYKEEPAVTEE